MEATATAEGARLQLLTSRTEIARAADVIAATDRIRYLSPKLHGEMIHELRWPGDDDPDSGIEVGSLEFDPADRAALEIIRRPDVMAHLASWNGGLSLGDETLDRINASSALAMVSVRGDTLVDYARGGAAAEAVWIPHSAAASRYSRYHRCSSMPSTTATCVRCPPRMLPNCTIFARRFSISQAHQPTSRWY